MGDGNKFDYYFNEYLRNNGGGAYLGARYPRSAVRKSNPAMEKAAHEYASRKLRARGENISSADRQYMDADNDTRTRLDAQQEANDAINDMYGIGNGGSGGTGTGDGMRMSLYGDPLGSSKNDARQAGPGNTTPEKPGQVNGEKPSDDTEDDDAEDTAEENQPNSTVDPEDENGYEHLDQSAETKAREDEREGLRNDDEDEDDSDDEKKPDTPLEEKAKAEKKLGEDGEALGELAKGAKALEEGEELLEGAEALEGLAAAWPVILAVLGVLVVLFMLIILFFVIFMMFPDKAAGTTTTGGKASVICLDPGHLGAPGDPAGAGGEAAIALKVADDVKAALTSDGYKVVMTRDGSSHVSLTDRATKCKDAGAVLMYAFHADGTARSKGYPYQIYMKPGRKESDTSKSYASKIQAAVADQVSGVAGLKNGGIEDETHTAVKDLAIFRGADSGGLPAVLTEMVQMKGGHSVLDDSGTRAKLVTGIVNGIENIIPATTATNSGGGSTGTNSLGDKVVAAARAELGKPYRWGATGPNSFDCSGLAQWAYKKAGLHIVRTSRAQYSSYTHIKSGSEQPGDLVFFGSPIHHVGVVIGNGKMIEAPHTGAVVRISSYHRSDLAGFSRPK